MIASMVDCGVGRRSLNRCQSASIDMLFPVVRNVGGTVVPLVDAARLLAARLPLIGLATCPAKSRAAARRAFAYFASLHQTRARKNLEMQREYALPIRADAPLPQ